MKNLMKIATALCLLGTCQFGWAGRGKKYEDSIAEQSKPKCVKNIEVSKTPMRPGPESLPISASTSSASTETAQSTTAQPAETVSVSKQQLAEAVAWVEQHYPNQDMWSTHGNYHSTASTSTSSTPQTTSSGTQEIVIFGVANNNDLRDFIRKQDLVTSGSFHAMTSDVAMMVPIEPTMSWEIPELLVAKAQAARLKQNLIAMTASASSASVGTAKSTITQPTESTPVSSSASSSSSSAWTSEDEEIYGPQTASTLTQEAQALFSSTVPTIAALAMTAMAMQTKSAH